MAIHCPDHALLYIQVPGTGCSVVAKFLREQLAGKDLGDKHDDVPQLLRKKHLSADQLRNLLAVANVRNPCDRVVTYFQRLKGGWVDQEYLAVLRRRIERERLDPSTSDISVVPLEVRYAAVERRLRRRMRLVRFAGFNSWFFITRLRWAYSKFSAEQGRDKCFPMLGAIDIVLKQERLEDAMVALLAAMGIDRPVTLPKKNITRGKRDFRSYYNVVGRFLARRWCPEGMRQFGYSILGETDDRVLTGVSEKGRSLIGGEYI